MAKQPPANRNNATSFTDTKRVRELVELMTENELTEIELVEDKSKITLRRGGAVPPPAVLPAAPTPAPHASPLAPSAPAVDDQLVAIKSPMVGTFYAAASPEAAAYVSVGMEVGPETLVCIIEAMKVFNEIRAETSGTIVKVLVANGQTVEYGQALFMVQPA